MSFVDAPLPIEIPHEIEEPLIRPTPVEQPLREPVPA